MIVKEISVERSAESQRVSARIDHLELWFRLPADIPIDPQDASPFLVAALVPAMLLGEDLEVGAGLHVSERLYHSLSAVQVIYRTWNPVFKPVRISADTTAIEANRDAVASFFSGGVDGTYTLLSHEAEINDLLLINGFDFTMDTATWSLMVERNADLAKSMGKRLVPVETNYKYFTANFGLARSANYGSVLAAVALLLRPRVAHLSAARTYRLIYPAGSHVALDCLWSTEVTEFRHTGLEADRAGKLAVIAQSPQALSSLWVCWKDPRVNCGVCSKCLRTALALEITGISADIFEHKPSLKNFENIRITFMEELDYYCLFLERARLNGRRDLVKLLEGRVFAYKRHLFLREMLRHYLPSVMALLEKRRPAGDDMVDIGPKPRYSDAKVLKAVHARYSRSRALEGEVIPGSVFGD